MSQNPEAEAELHKITTKIEHWCINGRQLLEIVRSDIGKLSGKLRTDAELELKSAEGALHSIEGDLLVQMRAPTFPGLPAEKQEALGKFVESREAMFRRHWSAANKIAFDEQKRSSDRWEGFLNVAIKTDLVILAVLPEIARYAVLLKTHNKIAADATANTYKVGERVVSQIAAKQLGVPQEEMDKGYGGSPLDGVIDGIAEFLLDLLEKAKLPTGNVRKGFKEAFKTYVEKPIVDGIAAAAKDTKGTPEHRYEEARKAAQKDFFSGLDKAFEHLKVPIKAEKFKKFADPVVSFLLETARGMLEGKSPQESAKDASEHQAQKGVGDKVGHAAVGATREGKAANHAGSHAEAGMGQTQHPAGGAAQKPKVKLTQAHHDWNRMALGVDTAARMGGHKPAAA